MDYLAVSLCSHANQHLKNFLLIEYRLLAQSVSAAEFFQSWIYEAESARPPNPCRAVHHVWAAWEGGVVTVDHTKKVEEFVGGGGHTEIWPVLKMILHNGADLRGS